MAEAKREETIQQRLDAAIRKIQDFPKRGILFYDLTGILMNPDIYQECIQTLSEEVIRFKRECSGCR
jgi:adenine/guanine phosphoribosyltransferase-like PRPP-binding protein